ncbi:SDR family oxidoreductase [Pontibacter sp. G13]|uniref:SDR family oxidoreductase n=1 Tax=Pontibacter sp. G13 TaxID=3074898 RepID=UPI00288C3561|nr:SDR family oxidoreductase [Pontibacter sp. G13]WNJ18094.1 SDR family oxidoreductase [Pontibacter sp. G13]
MKPSLTGKVAIVTGSSMGIGKAIARDLGMRGAKVVLNARNPEKLENTRAELAAEGLEVLAVPGDVSSWTDNEHMVAETIRQFGRLDILVNNAGVATRGGVESMTPEVFQKVADVNIMGSIFPSKAALPHLKETQGSVIFISSIASFYGLPFNSIYCASKLALKAFSESFRLEVKSDKVHVGIAYVGFTENDPNKIIMDADGKLIYLDQRKGIKKQTPAQVAEIIYNLIRSRRRKVVLSPAGKALRIITRFFPGLIRFIYTRNIDQIRQNSTGKPNYVKK